MIGVHQDSVKVIVESKEDCQYNSSSQKQPQHEYNNEMLPLIAIFLASAIIRIYLVARDSVPFAYDMGRDLLWAKDISYYGILTLIGPAASIWGVYFPPFWFYFLSVSLRLSGGHPLSAVAVTSATIIAAGILSYLLFRQLLSRFFALTLSIIILTSATLINISTFAFHANLLPLLTLAFIYFCYYSIAKNQLLIAVAFFLVGLMFSADPAPAVVMTFVLVSFFFIFKFYRSSNLKKIILSSTAAYLLPLAPNILFELRNNFVQTQSLLAYARGENPSLSGQLPLLQRIANRIDIYFELIKTSFAGDNTILALLLLSIITFGLYIFAKNNKNEKLSLLLRLNLLTVIVSFLVMTFIFTPEVKNWYLYGLTIPLAFLITFALHGLKSRKIIMLFLAAYMLANILPFAKNARINASKSDPAQLANQMKAIDYIYEDKKENNFSAYVFTPSIYDHNYQYLFWWQGIALDRGLPADFAYLPNQPDYVRNKNVYKSRKPAADLVYLIIENAAENEFYTKNNWLKNFQDYQLVWEKDINNAIVLQKRQK